MYQMNLGSKLKTLRKQRDISQEVLAKYLGVSFQAVSKWETGAAMPDISLLPALASFFGVSIDELLDFNLYEIQRSVEEIVNESGKYYRSDRQKCESILREGLKRYPGNDVLLNCLVGVLPMPEKSGEIIDICKALIESSKLDEVKYDAIRIMAEAYVSLGEYSLAKECIEEIPEIYFTKLQTAASLLSGEDVYEPAQRQKMISLDHLLEMLLALEQYYVQKGDLESGRIQLEIAGKVLEAFQIDSPTEYTRHPLEAFADYVEMIRERMSKYS